MFTRYLPHDNTTKIAFISFFSSLYFYSHVGTLYLQERGLTLFQANSIGSIIIGAIFLAEVPTGVIADRIGRKNSVIAAMALQVLGEVLYLFSRHYWAFALIAIIAGIGFAFLSGAVEALIYDTLPLATRELEMKKAMGLSGMAHQFAFVLAPVLGSFFLPTYTLNRFLWAVFGTACSVAVALLVAFTLDEPTHAGADGEHSPSALTIMRSGWREVRDSRLLQWLLLIGVFTATFSMSLVTLYQPYFARFEISAFWMGLAFAAGAVLAGLGERYAYLVEKWLGKRWGFTLATLLPGLLYLALATVNAASAIVLLFILTYGVTTLKNPLLSAYQNQLIQSKNRATVLSLVSLLNSLYVALISLLMGWLADVDLRLAFGLIGGVIVLACLVLRVDRIEEKLGQSYGG